MQPVPSRAQTPLPTRILDSILRIALLPHAALIVMALVLATAALGTVLQAVVVPSSASGLASTAVSIHRSSLLSSRGFSALLSAALVICVLHMVHTAVPGWALFPLRSATHDELTFAGDSALVWKQIVRAMSAAGQRVTRLVSRDDMELAAVQRDSPPVATLLAVAGILLVVGGTVCAHYQTWRSDVMSLTVGQMVDLGTAGDVRLEQIQVWPTGSNGDVRIDSTITVEGQSPTTVPLAYGAPASVGRVRYYQLGHGPAVRISATRQGDELAIRAVGATASNGAVRIAFTGTQEERLLLVPEAGVVVRLIHYDSSPDADPQDETPERSTVHVQLLDGNGGDVLDEGFLEGAGTLSSGDLMIAVDVEYYVSIVAQRESGRAMLFAGGGMFLCGLAGLLLFPARNAWLVLAQSAGSCHVRITTAHAQRNADWYRCALGILKAESRG